MLVLILPPFAVLPFMRMEQMTLKVKAQKASPSPQYGDRLKKSPDHAVNNNRKSEVESKSCNIFALFLEIPSAPMCCRATKFAMTDADRYRIIQWISSEGSSNKGVRVMNAIMAFLDATTAAQYHRFSR